MKNLKVPLVYKILNYFFDHILNKNNVYSNKKNICF